MENTWVLVAKSSRAKIYEWQNKAAPLCETIDLEHAASREHEQLMTSDLPGKNAASDGMQHHRMDEETSPKEQEKINFSKDLVTRLENGRVAGHFNKLIIVAVPEFLGLLRKNMSSTLKKTIVQEVNKNLIDIDVESVKAHLL